jgi:copper(I)-binding protein
MRTILLALPLLMATACGAPPETSQPSTVAKSDGAQSIGTPSVGAPSIGAPSIGAPSVGAPSVGANGVIGAIAVEGLVVRAVPGGRNVTAAYAVLRSRGGGDRLVAVSAAGAASGEIHDHVSQDGMMKMVRINGVDVPAGGAAALAPGGKHLMLFGVNPPYVAGQTVAVTLTFQTAGALEITAPVVDVVPVSPGGAVSPASSDSHAH